MYGKIFEQMYDSSVCENWKALVTFQQMIVLANEDGVVDMTQEAISRRTNIPLEIIKEGISELEKSDPRSRSKEADGRRIERIDSYRDWGWVLVNYGHYCRLANQEEKRKSDRERLADKRKLEKANKNIDVAECREESQPVANVAHIDVDVDVDVKEKIYKKKSGGRKKKPVTPPPEDFAITEEMREWLETNHLTHLDVPRQTQKFLNHHKKVGSLFADWVAAWRTWMLRADEYAQENARKQAGEDVPKNGFKVWASEVEPFLAQDPPPKFSNQLTQRLVDYLTWPEIRKHTNLKQAEFVKFYHEAMNASR